VTKEGWLRRPLKKEKGIKGKTVVGGGFFFSWWQKSLGEVALNIWGEKSSFFKNNKSRKNMRDVKTQEREFSKGDHIWGGRKGQEGGGNGSGGHRWESIEKKEEKVESI